MLIGHPLRTKHSDSFVKHDEDQWRPGGVSLHSCVDVEGCGADVGVCVWGNISAERNALRSACVIINGCQRLFSGRRRWQTALQRRRECVNASQGWMWVQEGSEGGVGLGIQCNIPPYRWSSAPNLGYCPHLLSFVKFQDIFLSCEKVRTDLSTPALAARHCVIMCMSNT